MEKNRGDTCIELEGSVDFRTEDADDFLDELEELVCGYKMI